MKSPTQDVLVERCVVKQGNGLVVGTSSNAFFRNITFRNCTNTILFISSFFKETRVHYGGVPPPPISVHSRSHTLTILLVVLLCVCNSDFALKH